MPTLEAGDVRAIQLAQLAYERRPEDLRYELKGTRQDFRLFNASEHGLPEAFNAYEIDPNLDEPLQSSPPSPV